jgi:hypothetical protein
MHLEQLRARLRSIPWWGWVAGAIGLAVVATVIGRPRVGFLDPGGPELAPDDAAPPPIPASNLATRLRIPLDRLIDLLEDAVPTEYGDLSQRESLPGHDRTDLAYHLERSAFDASLDGPTATVRTTIEYGVQLFYDPPLLPEMSGSCGTDDDEEAPRLAVTLRAPVAIDERWSLRIRARVVDIGPASDTDRDRCTVTFLDVDVTGRVVDAARKFLEGRLVDIDTLAAQADLRSSFGEWWRTLQEPIHLTDSLWLVMQPEAVRRGPTRGEGDTVAVDLALRARPTISYGPRPLVEYRTLPPLDTGAVTEGLDLLVDARAEYGAASDLLTGELGGREIEHEGKRVRLDSVRVFGIGGERLAVELRVSGDVAGRLYLVGTPVIDPVTARISVPDLDFDLATRDVVVAAAAWLRANELRDLLRDQASWPAEPAVRFMSRWLNEGLNRDLSDDLRVQGTVDSVHILGVRATRAALLVRIGAQGKAELIVRSEGGA